MLNDTSRFIAFTLLAAFFFAPIDAAAAATPMVSLGLDHALALRSDGTVVSWGSDQNGKLGTGRPVYATTAAKVPGLTGVKAIGSGFYHSLAILQDGTLWAWGSNSHGQLGDGTTADHTSAVQVHEIADVAMACGGEYYSLAVTGDGSAWSWGSNHSGQLGNGSDHNPLIPLAPARISGLTGVKSVACGRAQGLALSQDGTVWAWGDNSQGALGIGDPNVAIQLQPVRVPGLTDVVAIAAGQWTGAAVKSDGTVWEWGYVYPTDAVRWSPVQAVGISDANHVSAAIFSIAAIKSDGLAWWFWLAGTTPSAQSPVGTLVQAARGSKHTLLLKDDRTVLAFGVNASGQLGDGTTDYRPATPQPVLGVSNVVALAAGESHSLALDANGNIWAWGSDSNGQLGLGAMVNSSIPREIPGLTNIVQVSAGTDHSLAVDESGNVWSWGNNFHGQLGDGTTTSSSTPVSLTTLTNVQGVAAGDGHSIALKRDGTVWAWGFNSVGQLGNGRNNEEQHAPIQVSGLTNVVAVAANGASLALRQDGTVWAWGRNEYGQLGLGTLTPLCCYSSPPNGWPAQIPGLSDVRSVTANWSTSFAVKTDGTVMAWGLNTEGQLGDGSFTTRPTPALIAGLTGVAEVAAGQTHALARRTDGSVWGWGRNLAGEIGPNFGADRATAEAIAGVTGIRQISAGSFLSAMVGQDGFVYAVGVNRTGQVGDGTFAQHRSPVLVVNTRADGFLHLNPGTVFEVPPSVGVPFFVVASGGITDNSATVNTTTTFNIADVGKSGEVFVWATVPPGSLVPVSSGMTATPAPRSSASAVAGSSAFVLVNLTTSNWQPVVDGQLLPYMRGVIGDEISAQKILDNIDTTNLKGAQFCLGYGESAAQMISSGTMRVVATIPDPNTAAATLPSCILAGPPVSYSLNLPSGWNLLGNSLNQSLTVASMFNDTNAITSVWKWDANLMGWQFYTPQMTATELQAYAASKGYALLTEIKPGDGYWVNAKAQPALTTQSGDSFILTGTNLTKGWNLVATGNDITPAKLNANLKSSAVPASLTTLWAWDNPQSAWYFYAPSLEAQGGTALADYIASKNYRDFTTANKTLGNGTGFWVNR